MKTARFAFFLFALVHPLFSQSPPADSGAQFVFLPPGLQFAPLRSSVTEPRIGVFKFLDAGEMKVDIGNAIDVFGMRLPRSRLAAGIDFFAYAFVTGAEGLRLQIDAIDGFFGGHIAFSHDLDSGARDEVALRLRILHQSAHFVDGHYSSAAKGWSDGREPVPATRDFGDCTLACVLERGTLTLRPYGSVSYATLVRPTSLRRFAFLGGTELYASLGTFLHQPASLLLSYTATLTGTPAYAASHQLQVGVKFGEWYGKGPSLFLAWYDGRHMFTEYFDERITTVGAGFTVDFF